MRIAQALATLEAIAVALWLGGLVTVGAIVAPTVFGLLPAPQAADAMTAVFRRFDRLAMGAATLALLCEVGLATTKKPITRRDLARSALVCLMAGLAILEGAVFSPEIAELHRKGAIRGLNEPGLRLETVHRRAEAAGKAQFALGVAFFGMLIGTFGGTEPAMRALSGLPGGEGAGDSPPQPPPRKPDQGKSQS